MNRNYWPLFFIGIFSFVFGMIIWTIVSATKVPVYEDKSFLRTYQDVDENFNDIVNSNKIFSSKYNLKFFINGKDVGLTTSDINYSQRVLEKKSIHKDLLKEGTNNIKVVVEDKAGKKLDGIDISLIITKSISDDADKIFNTNSFKLENDEYKTTFNIENINNWNITGKITTKDNSTAYIYVKTNAI